MIKDLQQKLSRHQATFTASERRIATYIVHNLSAMPFETAASLGKQTGVSPMTVSRFLRRIGYKGLGALKDELRHEAPWVKLYRPAATSGDPLAKQLQGEVDALTAVYALARARNWNAIVKCIAHADRVATASFPFARFLGTAFAALLGQVRGTVVCDDGADGAYTNLLLDSTHKSCVVLIDTHRYSKHFRLLAEEVAVRGIPMVLITDSLCYWAADLTPFALAIPPSSERAWHSVAPIMALFSLLIDSVTAELGDIYPRIEDIGELRGRFTGYETAKRSRHR